MPRATQKQRHEFIHTLLSHIPDLVPGFPYQGPSGEPLKSNWSWFHDGQRFAERLMRYGATLGRLAEEQCNGYQTYDGQWDERATQRSEKKEMRIRAKVRGLCVEFGCKAVFQSDPRGNTLKIQVPDGYTNDWGREGICVPTS